MEQEQLVWANRLENVDISNLYFEIILTLKRLGAIASRLFNNCIKLYRY